MPIDLQSFTEKVRKYRLQFQVDEPTLASETGIPLDRLRSFNDGLSEPTGDEILIIADFFKCDYRFFISNEPTATFEQTENLFRQHGGDLSSHDRWAIQEFLYLCECEHYVLTQLGREPIFDFTFQLQGNFYKKQGRDAADSLRTRVGSECDEIGFDVFRVLRSLGYHVFRRRLDQSGISGMCIHHPVAGPCILINYNEDIYRQRFTAAHEAAHAILDSEKRYVVSYSNFPDNELMEIRANSFASRFLVPESAIENIPQNANWNGPKLIEWANRMKVNPKVLEIRLKEKGLLSTIDERSLSGARIPVEIKNDPELPNDLTARSKEKREALLKRGLSYQYIKNCYDAYSRHAITLSRLAEMLLCSDSQVQEIASEFGMEITYAE
jgi:Zn-dependent peptidase ImmA (M78 family)